MENCEKLINAGMDMEGLMSRLMGNASLVKIFVAKFAQDTTFASLKDAFAVSDTEAAERASHTLKGMCGNMSLTGLYALFTEQVNRIRAGELDRAAAMMPEITALYDKAIAGMTSWLSEQ